ncbi:MAG: hypothetical protein R2827_00840 [Bdellovibrionales bacterium]
MMSENESNSNLFSKKRRLSRFLAQEMLYDYVAGSLDEDREKAVKEFLEQDEELKREEQALRQAIKYCNQLSETQISEPLAKQIGTQFNLLPYIVDKLGWSNWPDLAKWAIQALGLSLAVAVGAMFLPWDRLGFESRPGETEIVVVEKDADNPVATVATPVPDSQNIEESEIQVAVNTKNLEVKQKIAEKIQEANSDAENEVVKSESEIQADEKTRIEAGKRLEAAKKQKEVKEPTGNPFVYRGNIRASKLDEATQDLVNTIKQLGGRKGGKVEIGWRKPNASYFHFIVNEEHLGQIRKAFGKYGEFELTKTPHRRMMPAGEIRFIIEVKDASVGQ